MEMSVSDDWDDPRLHVVDSSGYPYSQSFRYSQSPRENGLLLRFLAGSPLARKGMGGGCIEKITQQIMATRRRCILKGAFLMTGHPS